MSGKQKKKKNEKRGYELNEWNMDKTADKILQEMPTHNPRAYNLCCKVFGNRPASTMGNHANVVGHNLRANLAQSHLLNQSTVCQSFPYWCTRPIPLQTLVNDSDTDPVLEIMLTKKKWKNEVNNYKNQGAKLLPKMLKYDENIAKIPQHFLNMGNVLQQDPDPNFDNEFNWYYCGSGNILNLLIGGKHFLVHSVRSKLYVTPSRKEVLDFSKTATLQLSHENILETISNNQQKNTLLALRTRKNVSIVAIGISDGNEIEMKLFKTYTSSIPITSIEFNSRKFELLNIAYLDGNVHIISCVTGENIKFPVKCANSSETCNSWSILKQYDADHLFHLSKWSLNLVDTREFSNEASISFQKVSDGCNLLTSLQISSALDNCFYVGSTHNIFAIDIRFGGSHRILQKWTHGMESSPILLSSAKFKENEVLFCNSQWVPDTCYLLNPHSGSIATRPTYIPWRAPNILQSLEEVQLKGYCLDPLIPYREMLSKSITGAIIRNQEECLQALTLNSVGLISEQVLSQNHLYDPSEQDFPIRFAEKCSMLKASIKKKLFELSDCVDTRQILNYCNCNVICENDVEMPINFQENKYDENDALDINTYENFDIDLLGAWNLFDDIDDSIISTNKTANA